MMRPRFVFERLRFVRANVREVMNVDPDALARTALDAVLRNRAIVVPPRPHALLWRLSRVFLSFGNLLVGMR